MSEETMDNDHDSEELKNDLRRDQLTEALASGKPLYVNGRIVQTFDDLVTAVFEHDDCAAALLEIIEEHPTSRLARIADDEASRLADDVMELESDWETAKQEDHDAGLADLRYDEMRGREE